MYKQYFGLTRNPFEISPDPFFYHPTPRHNEALANLHYGVGRRKGFIVITGEVGTGKTLLVRCLLSELRKNNIAFGYVFNPLLPVVEFFQYIMADLGLPYSGRTKTEMLLDLNRFLIQRHARGLITALVVDEAQASAERTAGRDPAADQSGDFATEASSDRADGSAGVGDDSRLSRIAATQTACLVALSVAAAGRNRRPAPTCCRVWSVRVRRKSRPYSPKKRWSKVYEYSSGIPRIVNNLCENSMVNAFAHEKRSVTADMITEVAADFRLIEPSPAGRSAAVGGRARGEQRQPAAQSVPHLTTMDNQNLAAEKPMPTTAGRRI